MQREINKGNQVILFVNRRGHSSFVMCRKCSHTLTCPRCDLSLTYHDSDVLHCHYCGFFVPKPSECPKCQSKAIKQFGLGTQKVESFFRKCIMIPMNVFLSNDDIEYICDKINLTLPVPSCAFKKHI